MHPECDQAIEDVVNEAIVSDLNDSPVQIELSNLPVSDDIKNIIRGEFNYIKDLMSFDKKNVMKFLETGISTEEFIIIK